MSIGFRHLKTAYSRTPIVRERQSAILKDRQIFVNTLLLLTVFLFGILYLVQINSLATKGYGMRTLEKQIAQQKKENEKLQTRLIEAQALSTLQKKIETIGLVKSENIDYVEGGHSVATLR
ncbi:MAG: hypothetical protein Q7R79_04910 [bacterium]|nr:hypothetical protein [bacterium]